MRLGLQQAGQAENVPDSVCPSCYKEFSKYVSEGAKLRAEIKAKEANRTNMWAGRVALIRKGREYMAQRSFSDAAVAYEKYIRVLEVIHEKGPGELDPGLFRGTSQNKELTLIASVYWDLIRIYDTHPRYQAHQVRAAKKLADFVRYTPIMGDIARKAVEFRKSSKNKEAFDIFLRTINVKPSRCFIATAAFDSRSCWEVQTLCLFRDQILRQNKSGRAFIKFYYKHSPRIAQMLDEAPTFKPPVRIALRCASYLISPTLNLKKSLNL